MVIYNTNALIAAVVGVVAALAIGSLTGSHWFATVCGGIAVTVFDLNLRRKNDEESAPIIHPNAGAHIWFIPVWLLGIIGVGVGISMWLGFLK